MNTHADITQQNKTQSAANVAFQKQNSDESTCQFVDNRLEAVAQRKLQKMANNNSQARQTAHLQGMANNHSAQLQAQAYAQGLDILGPGQEKHLPHKAWHMVQQKQGRVKPTGASAAHDADQGGAINDNLALEREADLMGEKAVSQKSPNRLPVLRGKSVTNKGGLNPLSVRTPDDVLQGKFAKKQGKYYTVDELKGSATITNIPDKIFVQYIYDLASDENEYEAPNGKYFNLDRIVKFAKEKFSNDFHFGKTGYDLAGYAEFLNKTEEHNMNWSKFIDGQIEKARTRIDLLKNQVRMDPVHLEKFNYVATTARHKTSLPAYELDNSAKFADRMHGEKVNPKESVLRQPKVIQDLVHSVWAEVVWLEKKYLGRDTASMTPIPLIPVWGGTTSNGAGTFVSAAYQPNTTYQKGSTPEGISTPYEQIHTDRGVDWSGNTKFYIKGHLLNDHIGGPGQLYNLVPIGGHNTEEPATHSNWLHLFTVEAAAKSNIEKMQKARYRDPFIGQIVKVEYYVAALPPSSREGTQLLRFVGDNWPSWISSYKSEVTNGEPTILDLLTFLHTKSDNFNIILDAVRAVELETDLNYKNTAAGDISQKLLRNAYLWSLEDAVIPSGLKWHLVIRSRAGVDDAKLLTESNTGTVPSNKPSRLNIRYLGD